MFTGTRGQRSCRSGSDKEHESGFQQLIGPFWRVPFLSGLCFCHKFMMAVVVLILAKDGPRGTLVTFIFFFFLLPLV